MIVNLKKLVMPASAYSYPLKLSKTLVWVELTGEGHNYSWDGVILAHWFDGNEALVYCPKGRTEPFTVPDGVTEITNDAFSFCRKLPEIRFAGKMPKISQNAFDGCETLRISKQYLRVADKVPAAFAVCANTFEKEDFQWLTIHQTAKAWKEALEQNIASLDKADLKDVFSNFGEERITMSQHVEKLYLIKDGIAYTCISQSTLCILVRLLRFLPILKQQQE